MDIPQVLPLIYTSNGNVPEASLQYSKEWKIGTDLIVFTEMWHDSTGTLVKNNVHLYALKGLPPVGGEQAAMQ